jgi:uncharacterized C2H2 Zn-finger protein
MNQNEKLGCIYVIHRKSDPDTIKIGSSENFYDRINSYITLEPWFDNKSHQIWKFDIINSPIGCYDIDRKIINDSKNKNVPYEYLHGTGGKEHYKYNHDGMYNLFQYLNNNNIKYKMTLIDVDKIKLIIKEKKAKNKINAQNINNLLRDNKTLISLSQQCPTCKKLFKDEWNLKRHINKKKSCKLYDIYKCNICNRKFHKKNSYDDHITKCNPPTFNLTQEHLKNILKNEREKYIEIADQLINKNSKTIQMQNYNS